MKKQGFSRISGILSFLLFPYLLTMFINGLDTALMKHMPDLEWYLPAIVSTQIREDYAVETVKAQTVIARTNLYEKIQKDPSLFLSLLEIRKALPVHSRLFTRPASIYEQAAAETKNQVLTWKGFLYPVPYHEISSGKTRDGEEVFHDKTYEYLVSVDSSADKGAAEYLNSCYIKADQMPQKLEIAKRDSADFIVELAADGDLLGGEDFRWNMGLASADFTVQRVGNVYRFLCKGKGHGLGFSQYGGNELAKDDSTVQEVLGAYFPEMKILNIQGVNFLKSE